MIDNISEFISNAFTIEIGRINPSFAGQNSNNTYYNIKMNDDIHGEVYCPRCCATMRVDVKNLYLYPTMEGFLNKIRSTLTKPENINSLIADNLNNSLWVLECRQCSMKFSTLFYSNENDVKIAILPEKNGGLTTQNTPEQVSYYLDQAFKAKSIGANSACVAMYRAALEQLLFNQGYTNGMLASKIKKMEEDIAESAGPNWVKEIDPLLLKCIKDLGNGAIHPNNGEIEKQKLLDSQVIQIVDIFFSKLIDLVYEKPLRENNWKNKLSDKVKEFI